MLKKQNHRMHCPCCGDDRTEMTCNPHIISNGHLAENYQCKCGCNFNVEYQRDERGFWTLFGKPILHRNEREFE